MRYADYIRSAEWRETAKHFKEQDQHCQRCGSARRLDAHHVCYDYLGNEMEHPECIKVLCRPCHQWVHQQWDEGNFWEAIDWYMP